MNKKLRKFKKKDQEKKRAISKKEIIDQFTLRGFFTVSGYAILISIMLFPAFGLLEMVDLALVVTFNWKWCSFMYICSWLIAFWIFCLSPKMNGEME